MAKVKLSIKQPAWFSSGLYWHNISDAVIEVLYSHFELIPDYEVQCGWNLYSFLTDDQIRRLTLHVFGSTMPAMVEKVKQLVIVGNGDCPECGSNDRTDIEGGLCRNDYGQLCVKVLGYRCNNCNHEYSN